MNIGNSVVARSTLVPGQVPHAFPFAFPINQAVVRLELEDIETGLVGVSDILRQRLEYEDYRSWFEGKERRAWLVVWASPTRTEPVELEEVSYHSRFEEKPVLEIYGVGPYEPVGKDQYCSAMTVESGTGVGLDAGAEDISSVIWLRQTAYNDRLVGATDRTTELPESVQRRLEQLRRLQENWDSYGAKRISEEAIEKARSVLLNITVSFGAKLSEEVFVAPCPDGGLQLEWSFESQRELIVRVPPAAYPYGLFLDDEKAGLKKELTISAVGELDILFRELNETGGLK